MLTVLTELCRQ